MQRMASGPLIDVDACSPVLRVGMDIHKFCRRVDYSGTFVRQRCPVSLDHSMLPLDPCATASYQKLWLATEPRAPLAASTGR